MLNTLEIKNIKRLAASIVGFRAAKDAAQAKADAIDEKYRKMAEEKKGNLTQEIANLQTEIDYWQSAIISRYGKDAEPILNEIFGEEQTSEDLDKQDMKEDVVVDPHADDLFPAEEPVAEAVAPEAESAPEAKPEEAPEETPKEVPEETKNTPEETEETKRIEEAAEETKEAPKELADAEAASDGNWGKDDDWQMPENW